MIAAELRTRIPARTVLPGDSQQYLADQTEGRGVHGRADAVVLPESADEVAAVVGWCYEHGVPVVPRGGGTGYAAGAVPLDGGVVLALERLNRLRSFDPLLWRMEAEAGMRTADVRRIARDGGLLFAPDPGAAEQSHIGGNVSTNAGGPHAYKYGVTGAWVTGIEAVVAPGELVRFGGPVRKDVASYDVTSLFVGSEGTLGVITSVWLRLTPAPEGVWPIVGFFDGVRAGCAAIEQLVGSGLPLAAIEYLDGAAMRYAGAGFPVEIPAGAFCVITEADGSRDEAARVREEALELMAESARVLHAPERSEEIAAIWRWRDGVALRVEAQLGAKASEDIAVPLDRIAEGIEESLMLGGRFGLATASWGHAGDGNLHTTFLFARDDPEQRDRAARAAEELFALALRLGGTISGEHGVGAVKSGWLEKQLGPRGYALHAAVKRAFDPQNLMNPGKKI